MNETMGVKLIEDLKHEPEKFCKDGKPYELLQEYYKGLSIDTLRALFCFEDELIRRVAIWITAELGKNGRDLMKEVVPQINDSDTFICSNALQIVASNAHGEYMDDFIRVFSFLEHSNQKIRLFVMNIISGLSNPRIHEACMYFENKKLHNNSHEKGLLFLLDVNAVTSSEVTKMIDSGDAVTRKYGIIAATKLYKKYPQIVNEAVNAQDLDVREFSKIVVGTKNKSDWLMNDEK